MEKFKSYQDALLFESTSFLPSEVHKLSDESLGQYIRHHAKKRDYVWRLCVAERKKREKHQEILQLFFEEETITREPTDEGRINADIGHVVNEMLDQLPKNVWKSKTTTFLDPIMGGGQFIHEIVKRLRDAGHSEANIANRVFGFESDEVSVWQVSHRSEWKEHKDEPDPIGTFKDADYEDILKQNIKELKGMKFDVVVGNPPYQGTKALHQKFFNLGVDVLKDGGHLVFIQPANPYLNKKDVRKKDAEQEMLDNIQKYRTSVKFMEPSIFKTVHVATDLAITHLIKDPGNPELESVEYKDGTFYKNVELEEINGLSIGPKLFIKLSKKLDSYIEKNGSLIDVIERNPKQMKLRIAKIRGNKGTDDFYTFLPQDKSFWDGSDFGISVKNKKQRDNAASYLKSYIARFALGRVKIHQNLDRGELASVPLMDWNQSWNDEKLMKEFGITKDEYKEIRRVIPKYYDDVD